MRTFTRFQVSVGNCGVWGINAEQSVYFRLNTYGDPEDEGTGPKALSHNGQQLIF